MKQKFFEGQDIRLSYNENIFSFNLTAIHYSNTTENRLIYMLENYDKTWRESGVGQKAYYFNVPPGKYMLKIKASNGNGIWSQKSIALHVTPPWWRTWWAYTLYGLLLIVALLAFDRFQRLRLLERERDRARAHELEQAKEIERAYHELSATQAQLIQREKMASLGELTAGIAHEIQNPLNFVKNFSEVNMEMLGEIDEALEKGNTPAAKVITGDIRQNLEKIIHHGKRAESIVKGMLHHSRNSTNKKELTDINDLSDECLRLTYHGLRAKDKSFNAKMQSDFDESIEQINVIPQDIGRVFLNLFTNAFYSVSEKKKQAIKSYEPIVSVTTKKLSDKIEIKIKDNGIGIPQHVLDKIFQPFFTTKPTGQGTGLGLSLSYDVIKAHGGELKVETKEGEGAAFIIQLPIV
jgi:signal transduction histidine kinase